MRTIQFFSLLAICCGFMGCSSYDGPPLAGVSGTVTYKGKAIKNATVTMMQPDGSVSAVGVTNAEGGFIMSTTWGTRSYEGAPVGDVLVGITKIASADASEDELDYENMTEQEYQDAMNADLENEDDMSGNQFENALAAEGKSLLPTKYNDPKSSGLEETVSEDESQNVFKFEL